MKRLHPGSAVGCALAVLGLSSPSWAGIPFGVRAFVSNGPGGNNEDTDYGAGPGTYVASIVGTSVTSATANLIWQATSVSFTGSAVGGTGPSAPWAESTFLAQCTLTQACNVTINWNMSDLVAVGNNVSWVINDGVTDLYGVAFLGDPTSGTYVGVAGATASGTFTSTIPVGPGTYLIGMVGTANDSGGNLSMTVAFTPVPAPGGLLAMGLLGCRRRRRG